MTWVVGISVWLTNRIGGFWTEVLSGLLDAGASVLLAMGFAHLIGYPDVWRPAAILLAITIALGYELFFDRNGFELSDVGQRLVGVAIGLTVAGILIQ